MKDWNFFLEGFEKGVEAQVIAEVNPLLPLSDTSDGSASSDSLGTPKLWVLFQVDKVINKNVDILQGFPVVVREGSRR